MKRFIFAMTLALFALSFTSCNVCKVDGTEEGVFVKQPWFFGKGGVSQEPLTSGSEWKVFTTRFYTYSSVPTRFDENFDDIASDDGQLYLDYNKRFPLADRKYWLDFNNHIYIFE